MHIVPRGPNGARIGGMIAIAVLAIAVSALTYGALTGPAIGMGATAAGALAGTAGAAVSIGGSLLLNQLVPPPRPRSARTTWRATTTAGLGAPGSEAADLATGALCRHVLQHPARQRPAADAGHRTVARFADWDAITRDKGRVYNGVVEAKGSLWSALVDIARVGRATPPCAT